MKERLIKFLKYLAIGQDKFAKSVGLSRGYVNNIKDNITMKTVDKILKAYPELNKSWLLTGEGEMLNENHPENLQSKSDKKDGKNQILSGQFEHNFNEFIAIEKTNMEINKINAESFKKVAESHDILIKNHDKLLDLFKESLLIKNNSKIDTLIEKFDDFLEHSKQIRKL
jgi:transcriptional regulator with XRE-family HTH domain